MTSRDDLGRAIVLGRPARRVVSLTPASTENLFAIGAGALVVAVTSADNYPPAVQKLPDVGDFARPSLEKILSLAPDLIVLDSATVARGDVEQLARRAKAPVFAQKSARLDDVPRHLEQLGALTGNAPTARAAAARLRAIFRAVDRRTAGKPRPGVFVEVNATPLYAAGPGSFVDDLVTRAGGKNVVPGSNPFPVVSKESLLAWNPAHYVVAVGGDMGEAKSRTFDPPLDRLAAVRDGQIHFLPADHLFRPTPRLADGLVALARALHG